MNDKLYDKNGTPIERGDIVKVFHFTGARRKRFYMYKQAVGIKHLGLVNTEPYMCFSHLNMSDEYYTERMCGRTLPDYEVVQSIECNHEERKRAA